MQRQRMCVGVTWDLVRWHLRGMYGKIVEGVDADGVGTIRVSLLSLSSFLSCFLAFGRTFQNVVTDLCLVLRIRSCQPSILNLLLRMNWR